MAYLSAVSGPGEHAGARPMVVALFVSTCLLSTVSWYTTYQGMALYLSPWFALLASLGIQSALVMVAWLIGFTRGSRVLLTAVYAITALVSIAFSYVSLYTWFSAKERPAIVERKLYDALMDSAGKTEQTLAAAEAEAQKHTAALREMTAAEKAHGYISRAEDADPYLQRVREAVAREASSYNQGYKEGAGQGLRYTAFDRYTKLAEQSLAGLQAARRRMQEFRAQLKPGETSEAQIRRYREAADSVPWSEVEQALDGARVERPAAPSLADNLDRTSTGQEELLLAFTELVAAPTGRHIFALLLAAFIDLVVFLLAYASGPFFAGDAWHRWVAASAAVDGVAVQVFVRELLAKLHADGRGMARVRTDRLSAGERQFCLLLAGQGQAAYADEDGVQTAVIETAVHERLAGMLAQPGVALHAAPAARAN